MRSAAPGLGPGVRRSDLAAGGFPEEDELAGPRLKSRRSPLQMATDLKAGAEGYPPKLEVLVEGVRANGDASGRKLKFLRRIPMDPMTHTQEWGMRSYQDDSDSTSWGGQNVYDVYSKGDGVALDGTKYVDW